MARDRLKNVVMVSTGAALGAIATMAIGESRIPSSCVEASRSLRPGEPAPIAAGTRRPRGADAGSAGPSDRAASLAVSPSAAPQHDDAALRREIGELGLKLKSIEAEKKMLGQRLGRAEAELARREGKQEERRDRHEFDLDREDWKKLADKGMVKFRLPCRRAKDWTPSADELDRLGLAPDDAELLRSAYERSNRRVWSTLRPLCIEAVGNESVVDLLGPDTCTQVVLNLAKAADAESSRAAMLEVAETRAGERPPPEQGVQKHPVFELFWALTGETTAFQADLAENLGPDDARRIAFSDDTCSRTSSYSGAK